jgi:hypothetical protein
LNILEWILSTQRRKKLPELYVKAKNVEFNDYILADGSTVSSVYDEFIDDKQVITIFANWANGDIGREFAPDDILWIERDNA